MGPGARSGFRVPGVPSFPCALALAVSLGALLPGCGEAQVTVFGIRGLEFGQAQPGIPVVVSPNDAARRGEFEVTASGRWSFQVVVPAVMTSEMGETLPLAFGPDDIVARWRRSGQSFPLAPGQPRTLNLPPGQGGAVVHVGGRALPAATQAPGVYRGTVVLMVVPPGT